MRRGLVGDDVGGNAPAGELRQDVGGVTFDGNRTRNAGPHPFVDLIKRVVQIRRTLVDVLGGQPTVDARGVDFDDERDAAVHRDGERLGAAHPAEAGRDDEPAGEAAAEVSAREFRKRFVSALKDALRADVDPAASCHLAVHRQTTIFEISKFVPGRPGRNDERVGNQYARRPRMRAEDRDRFAGLHDKCFIVLEAMKSRNDGIERRPAASRAAGAAVNHEFIWTFGDIRIEVVHQHAKRSFLRPSLAGDRRASRRADMAAERIHRAVKCALRALAEECA